MNTFLAFYLLRRLACVLTIVPLMAFGQDKPTTETAPVSKLKGDYDQARGTAIGVVNKNYVAQAETLMKSFMAAANLDNASRASAFVKQLSDTDEGNDTDEIAVPPASGDRLGVLQSRYMKEREEAVRRVKTTFAANAKALQQQLMRTKDLDGAIEAAAFLASLAPGAAQAGGEALLGAAKARKWKPNKGDWKIESDRIIGSGDSEIFYEDGASPPFTLQFKIKVLDGMRPRVIFGPVKFANEGFEKTFGLYPSGEGAKRFRYEHNKEYKVSIVATKKKTDLFVDGQLVTTAPGVTDKVAKFAFCGGDGWSKGTTEFREIVLSK